MRVNYRILLFALLVVLLVIFQYRLWFTTGGLLSIFKLRHTISMQQKQNKQALQVNKMLFADVALLQSGGSAVEGRARRMLGMVKAGEIFYRVV